MQKHIYECKHTVSGMKDSRQWEGGEYVNKICFYIEKMSYYHNAVADTANDDDLKPLNLTIKVNTLLE